MTEHLNIDDPKYREAAARILQRHDRAEAEANITSAVRDFLILTKLVQADEIVEENAPALGSRKAVDLTALETFIEFKVRVGTTSGFNPNPDYVKQLDQYLAESGKQGHVRTGVLTDGKYWLLRWPNAGDVKTAAPYGFVLDSPDRWFPLVEWLRDRALQVMETGIPTREAIANRFGHSSPSYERDIDQLRELYAQHRDDSTVAVKRQLWQNLLTAALGELTASTDEMDDLFVRHTYLSAVIGMVVQARFGTDIFALAGHNPADLLQGNNFHNMTGLQGIVESDFFAWPAEYTDSLPVLKTLARSVNRFNWLQAPTDIAAILYETVIPPEERRQLGEYYTPGWLARQIVQEVVLDPLNQEVLDPSCGSGTFVAEAVTHFLAAAEEASLSPKDTLEWLRYSITGIDIHPVAVHLARAAWVLAALPALKAAREAGLSTNVTAPIYLGDSLQTRYVSNDMFSWNEVTIEVEDEANTRLVFPRSLVEDAESFDALMGDVAHEIEREGDPLIALQAHGITDTSHLKTLKETIATMQRLHAEGRNHIWAYYTRNLVRPVALANRKVHVIVGNPPWLNYNKTKDTLRKALEGMCRNTYGIWAGGRYATHQDIAGLFFARCTDLYLRANGVIAMVMPHSALQAGQYTKWRSGNWQAGRGVNFGYKTPWDLEKLTPKGYFPISSSVVFAEKVEAGRGVTRLQGSAEQWVGETGTAWVRRLIVPIVDTSVSGISPYGEHSTQGAVVVPRCLFFVGETPSQAVLQAGGTIIAGPRRGSQDKDPWKFLNLDALAGKAIEKQHVFEVHLGETLVPYATLQPLKAVLPLKPGDTVIPTNPDRVGGVDLAGLASRMRERWEQVSSLWETHKKEANKLNLLGQLDYYGKLSAQLIWRADPDDRPVRVIYSSSGMPTASIVLDNDAIIDYTLFWISCQNLQEAQYLLAIINSQRLFTALQPLMPKGLFGARHVQKHLWRLPIPAFDAGDRLHMEIAAAGAAAQAGVARKLPTLVGESGDTSVTIARRELRAWLRSSPEGKAVEDVVKRLLTDT